MPAAHQQRMRRRLFRRYAWYFVAAVCVSLLANGIFGVWYAYRTQESSLVAIQREQALAAAARIEQFVAGVESHLGWTVQVPWTAHNRDQKLLDAQRLLRQVPAIMDVVQTDAAGIEQLHVSRVAMDAMGRGRNHAQSEAFQAARQSRAWYGPVYFRRESEPYMTLAVAGALGDAGVSIAEVNLKAIWDVVSQLRVGRGGRAYVVDAGGRLIAHPDIALVLRNTELSHLPQVRLAATEGGWGESNAGRTMDADGQPVMAAAAPIPRLGWNVVVELPLREALAPVYGSLFAAGMLLLGGLVVAIVASLTLARRMAMPIEALQRSAERIGRGALDHRITVTSGDELEALGEQFNSMAARLQESYATLEGKVEERTRQLHQANQAKSRFVAAASHDLRQPMHALNLYLGTLAAHELPPAATAVLANARECARTMDALFRALLDMSRLDASVVPAHREDFPIADVLDMLRLEFEPQAQAKGLRLRVVRSSAVVHGDPALTGRILANLVSNAVRYTREGRILVGCRRTAGGVRVEVHDTGPGIPAAQQEAVFEEFYQVDNPGRDRSQGLGLGLAIVRRLAQLLDARLSLRSTPGRGSCFAIELPAGKAVAPQSAPALPPSAAQVDLAGALVFVVDDEATILHATGTLLRRWGCHVALAESGAEALRLASEATRVPDAILCDYRLARHETGVEVVAQLRNEFNADIPALLVTGDTAPAQIQRVQASGLPVLHKPLQEHELRAALGALLAAARAGEV